MSARAATRRLYVALVSLVAAILELAGALTRLGAALLARATDAVRARHEAPCAQARPRLRVVPPPVGLDLREGRSARLTFALIGMGLRAPDVRAFVAGLGNRVDIDPIESLIKEGLAVLAA